MRTARQSRHVQLAGHVLHQHLAHAFAVKRRMPGEHLVQHDAQGVDIDRVVVASHADFRGHVVDRAHGHRVAAAMAGGDYLAQAVVADLDEAFFVEHVVWLQIAVDDATVVQVGQPLGNFSQKVGRLGRRPVLRAIRPATAAATARKRIP